MLSGEPVLRGPNDGLETASESAAVEMLAKDGLGTMGAKEGVVTFKGTGRGTGVTVLLTNDVVGVTREGVVTLTGVGRDTAGVVRFAKDGVEIESVGGLMFNGGKETDVGSDEGAW